MSQYSPSSTLQRKRIFVACTHCRKRKAKCINQSTEDFPEIPCEHCVRKGLQCGYICVGAERQSPAPSASYSDSYPYSYTPRPRSNTPKAMIPVTAASLQPRQCSNSYSSMEVPISPQYDYGLGFGMTPAQQYQTQYAYDHNFFGISQREPISSPERWRATLHALHTTLWNPS
ncbi:hypothetical protein FB45DRAFT_1061677 [Roridomyces roridus]|uniref:Zn(2)-C6 fungal-type domain-containing protein n=1 Tax=Roridomyces roridus TaxID=1738132 RepID=A0AAD7FFW9_9AGAR|nr:hypothetical protein FB45DRAFT_1061677 [Roridomyces roridus]